MNSRIRSTAGQWWAERRPAIVVEVSQALGSAPRDGGARMLVSAAGIVGTIGGGHLELKAIGQARAMLRSDEPMPHVEHFALGPSLGQCCGGAVTLGFAALDARTLDGWPAPAPLFELQLYGAGHVGRAIATLLATLDCRVDWIDERQAEFASTTTLGSAWPSHIRRVCVDAVEAEVGVAAPGTFYLVLTHDHDLDLRITEAILRRGDFGFLGLIGSKTKRQRFMRRFEARGIPEVAIARLICPIGVEGIDGKEPEVIAAAVLAQMLTSASDKAKAGGAPTPAATTPPAARTARTATT